MKVVTKPGGVTHSAQTDNKKEPLTQEVCDSIAKTANAEAEKLGIKTRYEVVA